MPRASGLDAAPATADLGNRSWAKVEGLDSQDQCEIGQMITNARPMTLSSGMVPPPGSSCGPRVRRVGAVVTHDPEPSRRHDDVERSWSDGLLPGNRYGSVSATPLTVTRPLSRSTPRGHRGCR
jgi:hypothetical protein